ncbi:MAG: hypothetical protein HZB16_17160 [Armatimonadetes bacterium]|nr:hypothetical protein [Armatimonadota bacterium]
MASSGGVREQHGRNLLRGDNGDTQVRVWSWDSLAGDSATDGFVAVLPGQVIMPRGAAAASSAAAAAAAAGAGAMVPSGLQLAAQGAGYGLQEIMEEAEAIIKDAQVEAERVLAEAMAQAEGMRDQMFQMALEAARAELAQQADPEAALATEDLRSAAQALQTTAEDLALQHQMHAARLEEAILDIAFEVAEKVLGTEVQARPELVVESVRQALVRMSDNDLTIRVHPDDMPIVQEAMWELRNERNTGDMLSFQQDARVDRGGCIVESENGSVDARLSTKLDLARSMAGD